MPVVVDNDLQTVARWVAEKSGSLCTPQAKALGVEVDGILKVGVMYDGFTGKNGSISMHSRCDDPKATTRDFYRKMFDYPFNQLMVRRCTVLVNENNYHARQINERLGFEYEATLQDFFPDGNAIMYRMFRHNCKWLT